MISSLSNYTILDIGCGENKRNGALGLDFRRTSDVDIVGDAKNLPFKDQSFCHVYASHILEHFSHLELKEVLFEWTRVLKSQGTFEVRCPDLRARAFLFFLKPSWRNLRNIYGDQNYNGNMHKGGFSYNLLKEILYSVGIMNIRRVVDRKGLVPYSDLHVIGRRHL